jgi:hypothetical protein
MSKGLGGIIKTKRGRSTVTTEENKPITNLVLLSDILRTIKQITEQVGEAKTLEWLIISKTNKTLRDGLRLVLSEHDWSKEH